MATSGKISTIYPTCSAIIDSDVLEHLLAADDTQPDPENFPRLLLQQSEKLALPPYLAELARLEWAYHQLEVPFPCKPTEENFLTLNPSLQVLDLSWRNLLSLLDRDSRGKNVNPEPGQEVILLWKGPKSGKKKMKVASDVDLLILKMVIEKILPEEVARVGGGTVAEVDHLIWQAMESGILLAPSSRIRRKPEVFHASSDIGDEFLSASVFTLQWHITQTCDLHCKHCYDRSDRAAMPLERGLAVLDDLYDFCRKRHVHGQVSFSGGNPLLYPHFFELYQAAVDKGFEVAILGNPASREKIKELLAIRQPAFYQVSLEGLAEHNDAIRGQGHFERVMEFLSVLKDLKVYSMVMLTLTRDNIDQVLPLAEALRNKVDLFTFNRLAMVGEGASLQSAPIVGYRSFLEAYVLAAKENPCLALKDSLINLLYHQQGHDLFGGCAGYGCGAAFNFICALPDGEVHACRKFPSPIGNIYEKSLGNLYDSEKAEQYRSGCSACRDCVIRPVCGGCLAVSHGFGLNIFEERDPYCFIEKL